MNRMTLSVVLIATVAGCTAGAADTQPASQPAFEPIRYERNGGIAGTHDVVEITKSGEIVVAGKLMASGKGQLKPEQIAKLAGLFKDWKSLKAEYPTPPGTADGFVIKIRYGTVEVTANELNKDVPESFKAARAAIEEAARGVTPAK